MSRFQNRRWLSLGLMLLAVASLGLVACQAALDTKRGALGEFCNNRDSDCREGLICEEGVCVTANPVITDSCTQVCNRVDTCGVTEPNCIADCQQEIQNWGDGVVENFADCIVNDLTCEEIGRTASNAAQLCYDRLPLDEERVDSCRDLVTEIENCNPGASTNRFRSDCVYLARTAGEQTWTDATGGCLDALEFGTCGEVTDCVNTVFGYEGDNAF